MIGPVFVKADADAASMESRSDLKENRHSLAHHIQALLLLVIRSYLLDDHCG